MQNFLVITLALWFGSDAMGMSLRCNGQIIKQGMRKSEVRAACGEPNHTRGFVTTVKTQQQDQEALMYLHGEAWIYDFGPSERLKLIVYGNGIVNGVQQGQYPGKIEGVAMDCVEKDLRRGTSIDEIEYLCGSPEEKMIRERQYVKSFNGEREVILEDWHYGKGEKAKILSFREFRLASSTRKF